MIRNPRYGRIFYDQGIACEKKCSLEKRISYFKKAVYHRPSLSEAYYQLGVIYETKKDKEKAVEFYHKVIRFDHRHKDALFRLGRYYFEKGNLNYAKAYLNRCYSDYEHLPEMQYYMYHIKYAEKNYLGAILNCWRLIEMDAEHADWARAQKFHLYDLYFGKNIASLGQRHITRYLRYHGNSEVAEDFARYLRGKGKIDLNNRPLEEIKN